MSVVGKGMKGGLEREVGMESVGCDGSGEGGVMSRKLLL